jgi:hypothetical protein
MRVALRKRCGWARWALALQLLTSAGALPGLVLCVGEDGHLAIEAAVAEDCCASAPIGVSSRSLVENSSACACTDTPLFQHGIDPRLSLRDSLLPAVVVAALDTSPSSASHVSRAVTRLAESTLPPSAAQRARRSVVLLA